MDPNTIWQFPLRRGNSPDPTQGACVMDAVSWFEYGRLGDHPPCVSPVFTAFMIEVNDNLNDEDRQRLKPYILRLPGTVDTPEAEDQRVTYLAMRAVNVFAARALLRAGLPEAAAACREVTTLSQAQQAIDTALDEGIVRSAAMAVSTTLSRGHRSAIAYHAAASTRKAPLSLVLETIDGMLAIGRQAPPLDPPKLEAANRSFAEAQ